MEKGGKCIGGIMAFILNNTKIETQIIFCNMEELVLFDGL
jgi:hypothetical protein